MHRFYIPPEDWNPAALALTGPESHHCRNVLRLQDGAEIVVFDGRGHEITAQIISAKGPAIRLRKTQETQSPALRCRITLGQAIPKGKNMELIVQKAVEIGAAEIVPLISERTIVRLDEQSAAAKQAKWQGVAIEAAKQCGQNWLPKVQPPQPLSRFFQDRPQADLQLIGSLQPEATHLKQILAEYSAEHHRPPLSALILVGPEGDFTTEELALARRHGFRPLTLGPIVLRVETAAIYCLSILSHELLG